MKVFLSRLAESKLLKLSEYLLESWGLKTRDEFILKLNEKIEQIANYPNSCPESSEVENLYQCVVTKQTTFYYRILADQQEIEVITVFDTRQNPDRLKKEVN